MLWCDVGDFLVIHYRKMHRSRPDFLRGLPIFSPFGFQIVTVVMFRPSSRSPSRRVSHRNPLDTSGARSSGTPRLVGIDDWAWCKGQRYGTIVVDLETSDVIDLLPDRDAATVRTWLEAHPGIELVSRDRSSAYSQAAPEAVPGPAGRRSMAPVAVLENSARARNDLKIIRGMRQHQTSHKSHRPISDDQGATLGMTLTEIA